jgi:pimeloyl-ACP methyl ester carboxylesterase
MTSSPDTSVARRGRRRPANLTIALAATGLVLASLTPTQSIGAPDSRNGAAKPTIVLVHGAWADASGWNKIIARLQDDGYTVRATSNPLRSLATDAASVRAFLETLTGPIVLVGHSYGGAVITNAATGNPNVKALVYVNAFAPDGGESPFDLAGPDSALAVPDPTTVFDFVPPTLPPTATTDLYLKKSAVFESFAPGLSAQEKALVYATQRPAAFGGLTEPSGPPAWRTIPSWYLLGTKDKIIPRSAQTAMAERAGSTITKYDAGHLGLISDSKTVTQGIERAAKASVHVS